MVSFAGDANNDMNENIEDPVQSKFYKTPRPKVAIKLQKSAVTVASLTEEGPRSQIETSQRRSLRSRANTPRALKRIQDEDDALPKRKRGRRGRRSFHPSNKVEFKVLHSKQRLRRRLPKCMFCSFTCKVMKDLIIHCDLQHQDEVFRCTKCSFEGSCFAKLQTHEYKWKHYADDQEEQRNRDANGNPPGSTVWANFPIFILSNIRASHKCNKSWKMIRINRSIFPIFATSMTNTSVRQDESGKRNHKR